MRLYTRIYDGQKWFARSNRVGSNVLLLLCWAKASYPPFKEKKPKKLVTLSAKGRKFSRWVLLYGSETAASCADVRCERPRDAVWWTDRLSGSKRRPKYATILQKQSACCWCNNVYWIILGDGFVSNTWTGCCACLLIVWAAADVAKLRGVLEQHVVASANSSKADRRMHQNDQAAVAEHHSKVIVFPCMFCLRRIAFFFFFSGPYVMKINIQVALASYSCSVCIWPRWAVSMSLVNPSRRPNVLGLELSACFFLREQRGDLVCWARNRWRRKANVTSKTSGWLTWRMYTHVNSGKMFLSSVYIFCVIFHFFFFVPTSTHGSNLREIDGKWNRCCLAQGAPTQTHTCDTRREDVRLPHKHGEEDYRSYSHGVTLGSKRFLYQTLVYNSP